MPWREVDCVAEGELPQRSGVGSSLEMPKRGNVTPDVRPYRAETMNRSRVIGISGFFSLC